LFQHWPVKAAYCDFGMAPAPVLAAGRDRQGQRVGRNPKTGVSVPITPRRVVVFKASTIMKKRINGLPLPQDRRKPTPNDPTEVVAAQ